MKKIIVAAVFYTLLPLVAAESPRKVGCMHQSSDELTLSILEVAISMGNEELFSNVLKPGQVTLTESQVAVIRSKIATTQTNNQKKFEDLLNDKIKALTPASPRQ